MMIIIRHFAHFQISSRRTFHNEIRSYIRLTHVHGWRRDVVEPTWYVCKFAYQVGRELNKYVGKIDTRIRCLDKCGIHTDYYFQSGTRYQVPYRQV